MESFNFSFFSISGSGIDLDYCDIEWLTVKRNRDLSVIFEIALKHCISDSFVDYEGCSISFKGSLPPKTDLWDHPRRMGHDGEFWENVVQWRREWQTSSVFLPWEPHEQYEKAKRWDAEKWTPRSVDVQYATGEVSNEIEHLNSWFSIHM